MHKNILKPKMSKPKVIVMSGYGINCEHETANCFRVAGAEPEIVHINDLISGKKKMKDYHIMAFPGGFSYGDDTGSGNAYANKLKNNLWKDLMEFVDSGKLIIGICNGFQILTSLGLFALPKTEYGQRINAILWNSGNRLICRWVHLKHNTKKSKCVFTKGVGMIHLPIAHGEGRFYCDNKTLKALKDNGQVVFTYCDSEGRDANGAEPINPNGALADIAGICDRTGRILGMMPHPERALYMFHRPDYHLMKELAGRKGEKVPEFNEASLRIFKNAVDFVRDNHEK